MAELGKRVSLKAENRYLDVKKDYMTTFKELLEKYRENFANQASFFKYKGFCLENFKTNFGEETLLSNIRYVDLECYRNSLRNKLTKDERLSERCLSQSGNGLSPSSFQKGRRMGDDREESFRPWKVASPEGEQSENTVSHERGNPPVDREVQIEEASP